MPAHGPRAERSVIGYTSNYFMIHEIAPHKLDNEFKDIAPKPTDYLIIFNGEQTLFKKAGDNFAIPRVSEFPQCECHYLISIDGDAYFIFTPEEKGYYSFYSSGEHTTVCALRDEYGYRIAGDDNFSGEGENFRFNVILEGGKTVSVKAPIEEIKKKKKL